MMRRRRCPNCGARMFYCEGGRRCLFGPHRPGWDCNECEEFVPDPEYEEYEEGPSPSVIPGDADW